VELKPLVSYPLLPSLTILHQSWSLCKPLAHLRVFQIPAVRSAAVRMIRMPDIIMDRCAVIGILVLLKSGSEWVILAQR